MHACCPTLGTLDPAAAAAQVTSSAATSSGKAAIVLAAQHGMLVDNAGNPAYIPGTSECAASGISAAAKYVGLAGSAAGLALTGVVQEGLLVAGPATLGISIAIATIVGIFSTILNHHAQAVKKEQSVLCSAVPAANNYLQIIEQGVQSGLATPQQGIDALNSLVRDFTNAVSSIEKNCNAACIMTEELQAVVLVKQSEYQDLIAAQQAQAQAAAAAQAAANAAVAAAAAQPVQVVTPSRPNTTAPAAVVPASSYAGFYSSSVSPAAPVAASGGSNWLPIAAALAAGFLLTRIL
jgi:predicted lactoylglutathione lyase